MKRLALLSMLVVIGFSFSAPNAEAKRLGGGGSFGKQRDVSPQQMQKAPAATPAASPAAAAPAAGNKWLGPLAGLALGAGLFALLSSAGLDGALGGILMALLAAGAVMFLLSRFRKSQPSQARPAMQYAGNAAAHGGTTGNRFEHHPVAGGAQTAVDSEISADIPADFPVEAFLRSAKTSFIRLQAANDRKDINDIREYTTPEMFAEISMQINERDNTPQSTNVLSISTTLLSVQNEGDYAIASVRMSGELSENKGAAESFDEVWHVQKSLHEKDAVWLLAGIQQVA